MRPLMFPHKENDDKELQPDHEYGCARCIPVAQDAMTENDNAADGDGGQMKKKMDVRKHPRWASQIQRYHYNYCRWRLAFEIEKTSTNSKGNIFYHRWKILFAVDQSLIWFADVPHSAWNGTAQFDWSMALISISSPWSLPTVRPDCNGDVRIRVWSTARRRLWRLKSTSWIPVVPVTPATLSKRQHR